MANHYGPIGAWHLGGHREPAPKTTALPEKIEEGLSYGERLRRETAIRAYTEKHWGKVPEMDFYRGLNDLSQRIATGRAPAKPGEVADYVDAVRREESGSDFR